jgi:signal peptidase I
VKKRSRLRSCLLSAALIVSAAVAWHYFAPSNIGGSTRYVATSGISMQPRFHTGDLAIVRPAASYHVGEIVAYHSTMLHLTVLHRIIGRHGDRYVFKGDNNSFIDPVYPTRAELLGKLWIHVAHGGVVLRVLHTPWFAAVLCAVLAVLLLLGVGEKQRRRRRPRKGATGPSRHGPTPMRPSSKHHLTRSLRSSALFTTALLAAVAFVVLGLISFAGPARKPASVSTPYNQRVSFGYSAEAPAGPVYPDGVLRTGDPIFIQLVHRLGVHVDYRFESAATHAVSGTEEVLLRLRGTGGWSRSMVLAPTTRFTGDHTSTDVTLDLNRLEGLLTRVAKLTGVPGYSSYTITIEPRISISGSMSGEPVKTSFAPGLGFSLNTMQLVPGASSGATGPGTGSPSALKSSKPGSVASPSSAPNTLSVLGVSAPIGLLRWISVLGLLLSIAAAIFLYLCRRSEPFEESVRIQSQYGHMIVPIVGGEDLGWPPVDVPSIKSLVMLAESGQRLILHNRKDNVDTYMVNEEGTVYRYQVKPSKVVWGDWSETATPVQAAA